MMRKTYATPISILLLILMATTCNPLTAAEVRIAIAANFTDVAQKLASLFEKETGHTSRISYGSSGKLFAQIKNGAPFDIYLSADTQRPAKAEKEGLAVVGSRFIYAKGRLVLWSAESGLFNIGERYLKTSSFRYAAMANPKTAPYGLAAQQVLKKLGIWQKLQGKLVRGDSIAQTFQFVATRSARIGFVALSQVRKWKMKSEMGTTWEIPANYYTPINQAAVLLEKGKNNSAALAYMTFLNSDSARTEIRNHGYGVSK